MQYTINDLADDRRIEKNNFDYDERIKAEYKDSQLQLPSQTKRMTTHHSFEKVINIIHI